VIRQTDRATRLVSLHGTIARFIRDHMMSLLTQIPGVAEKLGEGLSGLDREGVVAKRYGSAPAAYLIRPDGYVGFRCDQRTVSENLPHYLAKLFSSAGSG
jgi:hypothetical protein